MRGHDLYPSFRLDSEASAMSSWRSIKQSHNQCVGNLFSLLEELDMTQRNFQLSCWKLVLKVVTLACNAFMSSHSHVEDCPPDHSS